MRAGIPACEVSAVFFSAPQVQLREVHVAQLEARVALREVPHRGRHLALGALGDPDNLVEASEPDHRQHLVPVSLVRFA